MMQKYSMKPRYWYLHCIVPVADSSTKKTTFIIKTGYVVHKIIICKTGNDSAEIFLQNQNRSGWFIDGKKDVFVAESP